MERLTIAEYAERNNISVQAVYKKLKKLKTVKEERGGRNITLIELGEDGAAEELNPIQPNSTDSQPQNQPNSTDSQPQNQPISTADIKPNSTQEEESSSLIELLKRQLEEKDRQLQEKDKQIDRLQAAGAEKDKQIQEQFERLSSLLLRSQELEAMTHKLLLGEPPEKDIQEAQPPEEIITTTQPAEETAQPPERKSFWKRLFGK